MTEAIIQNALHNELLTSTTLCVPNYTPDNWWECDLWHVTKSGYGIEHEVKITKSDFKADRRKCKRRLNRTTRTWDSYYKYEAIEKAGLECPKNFWYITPPGLLSKDDIPSFAGLKEIHELSRGRFKIVVIVKAPNLHKHKVRESVIEQAKKVFYYRYWDLRKKHYRKN